MMDEQKAREALEAALDRELWEELTHNDIAIIMELVDAYTKEAKLAVLAEILREGYTLEQIEDMRRNVEEVS